MSGHKNAKKSPMAEWDVRLHGSSTIRVPLSRKSRTKGGYTFADDLGDVADFPPGVVLCVERKPAAPVTIGAGGGGGGAYTTAGKIEVTPA